VSGDVRVGQVGIAITPLRPSGKMQAGDKIIDVVAQMGFIAPGAKVRVVVVTEFRIEVEAVEGNA
jgi:membrane-bound serine protease (ClpP class)